MTTGSRKKQWKQRHTHTYSQCQSAWWNCGLLSHPPHNLWPLNLAAFPAQQSLWETTRLAILCTTRDTFTTAKYITIQFHFKHCYFILELFRNRWSRLWTHCKLKWPTFDFLLNFYLKNLNLNWLVIRCAIMTNVDLTNNTLCARNVTCTHKHVTLTLTTDSLNLMCRR